MGKKKILSSAYNLSFGYIPVIVSIISCEFFTQDTAIYIGTLIGLLWSGSFFLQRISKKHNFILYFSTGVLFLFSLSTAIPYPLIPDGKLPITLEINILMLLFMSFIGKRRIVPLFLKHVVKPYRNFYYQGIELAYPTINITLLVGAFHLVAATIAFFSHVVLGSVAYTVLYKIIPSIIFVLIIILNQIAIIYFNNYLSNTEYIPIVNLNGDVKGKMLLSEVVNNKSKYVNPIVRIVPYTDGMVFLSNRSRKLFFQQGKFDVPMEHYIRFGETVFDGAKKLFHQYFPLDSALELEFNIMYHYKDKETDRLVYLFLLHIDDESVRCNSNFYQSKLWNFKQIDANLGKAYFSDFFEEEYEYLKEVIYTKEIYKES